MPRGRPRTNAAGAAGVAPAATRGRANNRPQVPFAYKLVLNQWLLSLFNVQRFEDLAEHLRNEALEGLDENNVHHFHHALTAQLFNLTQLPTEVMKRALAESRRNSRRNVSSPIALSVTPLPPGARVRIIDHENPKANGIATTGTRDAGLNDLIHYCAVEPSSGRTAPDRRTLPCCALPPTIDSPNLEDRIHAYCSHAFA